MGNASMRAVARLLRMRDRQLRIEARAHDSANDRAGRWKMRYEAALTREAILIKRVKKLEEQLEEANG